MKIQQLQTIPSLELIQALEIFESEFTYPLGEEQSFHISHGEDYSLFFRAMGEGICFVAKTQEKVVGVIGVALKDLIFPTGECKKVVYIGDLKIATEARGGRVLFRLAKAVQKWAGTRLEHAFAVVMKGTSLTPDTYTGRAKLPHFQELMTLTLFGIPCSPFPSKEKEFTEWITTEEEGYQCYLALSKNRYASGLGSPKMRSLLSPIWLKLPDNSACGMIEDTRKAKKLFTNEGKEMVSAHLSYFAYQNPIAGQKLIRKAIEICGQSHFPNLFVSVPEQEAKNFEKELLSLSSTIAPAIIYGTGFKLNYLWNINTSEI